eukprot:jgi/Ulvmu1/12468/UM009_0120.1
MFARARSGDRGLHFDARPGLACLVQSPALNSFQLLCTCHATGYVAACAAQSSSMPGGSVALSTAAANAAAADSIRPLIQQAWSFCTTGHWAAQHTDVPPMSLAPEPSATPSITLPPSVYEFHGSGVMGLSGTWDECPPW